MSHIPVLKSEVLQYLNPKPNENFIDGTVGNGGHANLILGKTGPFGKLIGIDADAEQINNARRATRNFNERIILVNDSYANLKEIAERVRVRPIDGILLDLGYSSWHVDESGKGFSFQKDEPLDMRYGSGELTAEKIVNEWPEKELEKIISQYGEENFSKKIAREITRQRKIKKIKTTFELRVLIEKIVHSHEKIHPATRTFQALRIAVNSELENLEKVLPQTLEILAEGGRLAVISFHSLEDRIVKNFFNDNKKITILTKKPVTASDQEIANNLRARSAKLRAIIKV